jgi:hypothetical protein
METEFKETTYTKRAYNRFDITKKQIMEISEDLKIGYGEMLFKRLSELESTLQIEFINYHLAQVSYKYGWMISFKNLLKTKLESDNWLRDALLEGQFSDTLNFIEHSLLHLPPLESIEPKHNKITDNDTEIQSFNYKNMARNSTDFYDFITALKSKKLIDKDVPVSIVKNNFSGLPVQDKIVWIGGKEKFCYFIKYIHDINPKIEKIGRKKWKVALNCFCDENKNDFNPNVRKQAKPSIESDVKAIEYCVELLK